MGVNQSKSPLERRNTMVRRSQRKSIHSVKAKVDKLYLDIKKFRGVEEDEQFNHLLRQIDHLRDELYKKSRELQPQLKYIYEVTLKHIEEAEYALEEQLEENREYHDDVMRDRAKRKQELQEKSTYEKNYNNEDNSDEEERNTSKWRFKLKNKKRANSKEVLETTEDKPKSKLKNKTKQSESEDDASDEDENSEEKESEDLSKFNTEEKRHTVELKFIKVIQPEETVQAEVHNSNNNEAIKSPEDKRKSILKVGVPVMPGAMLQELTKKAQRLSVHYEDEQLREKRDSLSAKVNSIIESLQSVECQIADFIGKRHGTQYNRIKGKLNSYIIELEELNTSDDFVMDQVTMCKNYVGSCLNFLEEKAIDSNENKIEDDVFLPAAIKTNNNNTLPLQEVENKFQRLSKTTAI